MFIKNSILPFLFLCRKLWKVKNHCCKKKAFCVCFFICARLANIIFLSKLDIELDLSEALSCKNFTELESRVFFQLMFVLNLKKHSEGV